MTFILDKDGKQAVNTEFVMNLAINRNASQSKFKVVAETYDNTLYILKEFSSDSADENSLAAKKYLAELVASLNGGQS